MKLGALLVALVAAVAAIVALGWLNAGEERFRVEGNRILDPGGEEFTIKGVVAPFGPFAGSHGDELSRRNEAAAPRDFTRMRRLGVNTVKVYVTPGRMTDVEARRRLDRVIEAARREDLLVLLAGFWGRPRETRVWLRRMATRYRHDAWVWLLPMNEPGCTVPDATPESCRDWDRWQREHRAYVRIIRDAGMTAPIVVNAPGWSWSLSAIAAHPLGDDDLVLGAHRYANEKADLDAGERREVRQDWARLAGSRPVVLDEVGSWNGPQFANSLEWARDMVEFVAEWVGKRHGAGAIGFNWRWSDPNSMVDAEGGLSDWGEIYVSRYLREMDGGGG
jgi:hypothetical protein